MYCLWKPKNVNTTVHVKHAFHLVDPSPWPVATAVAVFGTALGVVLLCHRIGVMICFLIWPGSLFYFLYRWFQDIITESVYQGNHTRKVIQGLKFGMLLFIVSEIMFFFSFFFAYFYFSSAPSIWVGGVWPPKGVSVIPPGGLATTNSYLLLLSGVTFTWAHSALIVGNRLKVETGLAWTLLFAVCFTGFQAVEYKYSTLHINDSVFGSLFYMITGFHGFHVLIGTIFIATCYFRVANPKNVTFTRQHHFGFMAALWYWHFVDVVWLFVFFIIYVWGPLQASI